MQIKGPLTECGCCEDLEEQKNCLWYPKDCEKECYHIRMIQDICHCERIKGEPKDE